MQRGNACTVVHPSMYNISHVGTLRICIHFVTLIVTTFILYWNREFMHDAVHTALVHDLTELLYILNPYI